MLQMKKKQVIFFLILLMGLGSMVFSKQLAELQEILNPNSFVVDGNRIYIVQKESVHLYSKKTFKLEKTFGQKGEGPGEFRSIPWIEAYPDYLLCNTYGKLLFFSKIGEFLREKKTTAGYVFRYQAVGNNWVGMRNINTKSGKITRVIELFDKELKLIKELARQENAGFQLNMKGKTTIEGVIDFMTVNVSKDKIYLGKNPEGISIDVFDSNGKKLYEIKKKVKKQPVTDTFKKEFIEQIKQNDYYKQIKGRVKYEFRDYFPAFKDIRVKNGKLYVFTYEEKDEKGTVIVMDLKGNVLKSVLLPSVDFYSIENDRFYYIKEDEDTEEWGLFVEQI